MRAKTLFKILQLKEKLSVEIELCLTLFFCCLEGIIKIEFGTEKTIDTPKSFTNRKHFVVHLQEFEEEAYSWYNLSVCIAVMAHCKNGCNQE